MNHEISKEIKYMLRSGKMLILMASFLFFALLTPLMLKVVLPEILMSQGATSENLSGIMNMTQSACIQTYMNDVFEIGTIIISFTLCGLLAQEIQYNTLVFPLCSGRRFYRIIGAKLLIFGAVLMFTIVLSLIADYLYAGMLFSFEVDLIYILRAGTLQGLYMIFLLCCIIMWGAILKKPIPTGFLTLSTTLGLYLVGELFGIHVWLPSGLLIQAQHLTKPLEQSIFLTMTITAVICIGMFIMALIRLKKIEWNSRQF